MRGHTAAPGGVLPGRASKIGKSWMVLDWCVRIAKGEPVWGLPTQKGTTLYLCLEDTLRRVQDRLNRITEEVPGNAYFSAQAETMAGGLLDEIRRFVGQHPDTVLVAVDTFAVVRALGGDQTYGSDYQEVRQLKALADELKITLLMVHHVRKLGDSDPLNRLSGTTGIVGAADTVLILERSRRSADCATFYATGRDTEYREMELRFHRETCSWELLSDTLEQPEKRLPQEMQSLVGFMKKVKAYKGGNGDFAQAFNQYAGTQLTAKVLKQLMKQWRFCLEDQGVRFVNRRSNGRRLVEVFYTLPVTRVTAVQRRSPLGAGKARLRPCEGSVRPWERRGGETTRPGPEKASVGPLGAGFGGDSGPGEAGKAGGEETAVPAVPCGPGGREEGRKTFPVLGRKPPG